MHVLTLFFGAVSLAVLSDAAKILAVVPTPTKSHHYLVEKLALDLTERGHQVTLITPFPQSKPVKNLEEIIFPNYYDDLIKVFEQGGKTQDVSSMQKNPIAGAYALHQMGAFMTDIFLSSPPVKEFLKSNRKYDAVIGEAFFVEAALAGFSKKFNAPLIAVATGPASYFSCYLVGNPSPSSYVPSIVTGYTDQMTFMERVFNFLIEAVSSFHFQWIYLSTQDAIMRKHFGDGLPNVRDIITNTSLVLVNHHYSLAFPRPYLPNMVEIGGFHVKPPKPLPEDLKQYVDNSKHGVIIFSLGSHFKSSYIPKETVQEILKAFSRLKENVIWKFDSTDIPNLPKNVKIMKWLPQSDIIAHPNVKLLITHGGMLSITEAVVRGMPIIGLPLFGDQPSNMKFAERNGYGKSLSITDLNEKVLYETIMELLQNPKYRENMKKRSELLQDTTLTATETAMYWIEYVIRHKGAPHLRSAAQDLEWYQLYLLDVLAVFAAVVFLSLWIWYKIATGIWRKLCGGGKKKKKKAKKE